MDTQDQKQEMEQRLKQEASSPGVMSPDTTMGPGLLEMADGATVTSPPDATTTTGGKQELRKSPTPLQDSLRRLRRDKRAMVSLGFILLFIIVPLIGPIIYQHIGGTYQSTLNGPIGPQLYHNPFHQELDRQDEFISGQYLLGTDSIGRDLLARLMQGLLVSLSVAIGLLQMFLDRGELLDWFDSWEIKLEAAGALVAFAFFAVHTATVRGTSFVDRELLKDRNRRLARREAEIRIAVGGWVGA